MIRTALISFLVNSINTRTLSAYLKANGHEVICLFCPESINDQNLEKLIQILIDQEIGLVGISVVTDDYRPSVDITRAIKEKTKIPVIWGGAHASVMPEECLRHADMVCIGEGEEALLELVQSMSNHSNQDTAIHNIWTKTPEGIIKNELRSLEEKLDEYPFPDFDLQTQFVMNEQGFIPFGEQHLKGEYSIMTSRGCPYSCHYCYNSYRRKHYKGKGRYLRARTIDNVIEELSQAKAIFKNINRINFWDDSFVHRTLADFESFKKSYLKKIKLPFFALIEPMAFNFKKITLLKECGLQSLQIGIQTGSERVNSLVYGRRTPKHDITMMADQINSLGIKVVYDLIFNNPYETREDLFETLNLLFSFPEPFSVQGYNLIFYPGTEITDRALRDGHISLKRKSETDDFSTIENKKDSPVAMKGRGKVSGRFYQINYKTHHKEYLNTVISLMDYRYIPKSIINFFGKSETKSKKIILYKFLKIYDIASKAKNSLITNN